MTLSRKDGLPETCHLFNLPTVLNDVSSCFEANYFDGNQYLSLEKS